MAKDILEKVIKEAVPFESLLQDSIKISDVKLIQSVVSKVLTDNQKVVQDYKKGKREAIQFLVGQTMKAMKGQADPEIIREVLTKELEII